PRRLTSHHHARASGDTHHNWTLTATYHSSNLLITIVVEFVMRYMPREPKVAPECVMATDLATTSHRDTTLKEAPDGNRGDQRA
ncbi:MAG TPA: hypothetical protein VIG30_16460, partial [Ktedonobacterales bacterium]